MSCLCDLFLSFIQSHECRHTFSFSYCLKYALLFLDDNVDEECE